MSWRERIETVKTEASSPKQTWRDRVETATPVEVSKADSFARGALDSASMGWLDELAGSLEALGSKVGVRGLGGNSLSDIRLETDEEDKQSYDEVYSAARDSKRKISNDAREANPTTYGMGEVAGGIAGGLALAIPTGGALTAGRGLGSATLRAAGVGALDGAVTGAGYSEAGGLSGVAKDAARGAAISGVLGGAMPVVGKGLNALASGTTKFINKVGLDLDTDITDRLLKDPTYVDNVRSKNQIEREVVDATNSLSRAIDQWDDEAWKQLDNTPFPPSTQAAIKADLIQTIKERLKSQGHLRIGEQGKEFAVGTAQSRAAIKKAEEVTDLIKQSNLSEQELKRIIKTVDAEVSWGKQELKSSDQLMRTIRHDIDEPLKTRNENYRKAMSDLSGGVNLLEDTRKGLRLQKEVGGEFVATDTTERKLNTALKGELHDTDKVLRGNLEKLSEYRSDPNAGSFLEDLNKLDMARRSTGGVTNGGRGVLGGSVLGLIFGGGTDYMNNGELNFGTLVAGALGGAAGLARDKYGRSAGRGVAQLVGQMQNNYGKYFAGAAAGGANKMAVNHYLLYNKDKEYQRLYDEIQKELETGDQ